MNYKRLLAVLVSGMAGAATGKLLGKNNASMIVGGTTGALGAMYFFQERDFIEIQEEILRNEVKDIYDVENYHVVQSRDYGSNPITQQIFQIIWGQQDWDRDLLNSHCLYFGPDMNYETYSSISEFESAVRLWQARKEQQTLRDFTVHVLQLKRHNPVRDSNDYFVRVMLEFPPKKNGSDPTPLPRDIKNQLLGLYEKAYEEYKFPEPRPIFRSIQSLNLVSCEVFADKREEQDEDGNSVIRTYYREEFKELSTDGDNNYNNDSQDDEIEMRKADTPIRIAGRYRNLGSKAREAMMDEQGWTSLGCFFYIDIPLNGNPQDSYYYPEASSIAMFLNMIKNHPFTSENQNGYSSNSKEFFVENIVFHPGEFMDEIYCMTKVENGHYAIKSTPLEYFTEDEDDYEFDED